MSLIATLLTPLWSSEFLAATAITLGGSGTYWFQRRLGRQDDLITRKKAAYEAYLTGYIGAATAVDGEKKLNAARMAVALVASDDVLRKSFDFDNYAIRTASGEQRDPETFCTKFASTLAVMRADVFEKTKMSEVELRKAVPVR